MNPAPFAYAAPTSLAEAISLLADGGEEARALAGGQSLLPAMKLRLVRPSLLVDLRRLRPELSYIEDRGDTIALGALTTHAEIERSPLLAGRLAVLPRAAHLIADRLIRSSGTIGGSVCHVDPAGDWAAVALALDADALICGSEGDRTQSVESLIAGPYTNSLEPGELLREIRFRVPGDVRASYRKIGRQGNSDFAIVGCCAVAREGSQPKISIAFTGLAAVPYRDRAVEEALATEPLEAAVAGAGNGVVPLDDVFGSAEYRVHLARALAKQALADIAR
jgi:aerobic carbon-monoxide dehydrogenase medium subunit